MIRLWRWLQHRTQDLFYGPDNGGLDLGRVIVAFFGALMGLGTLWNIHLGKELDLGPGGLGGGIGAVLGAGAALIAAKDRALTKHMAVTQASDAENNG